MTSRTRWLLVIAGGVIMGASLGIRNVQGLFMLPVTMDRGWSRESFSLAIALQNLIWGFAQPITGMISDRFGSGKVIFAGAITYAVGLFLMAQSTTPVEFTFAGGFLVGIALSGTAFGAVYGALSRLFAADQCSWALSVAGMFGGLGQFCVVPLGDIHQQVDGADEPPGGVAQRRRIGHEPHPRAVGPFGDGLHAAHLSALFERDRHWALVVTQRPAIRPIQPPRAAPLTGSELGIVAPELSGGAVVKGNAALGVGGVDRDRQRLEQVSPGDHRAFPYEFCHPGHPRSVHVRSKSGRYPRRTRAKRVPRR